MRHLAGKPDATNNLLGMMVDQQAAEGFTDQEILHETAMFYAVRGKLQRIWS